MEYEGTRRPRLARDPAGSARFGNQVFKYIAYQFLGRTYGYEMVASKDQLDPRRTLDVDEAGYDQLVRLSTECKGMDIFMHGYYQDLDMINRIYPFVLSLFTQDNTDEIYRGIRACDMVTYELPRDRIPGFHDLVIHLRLDDFIHNNSDTEVMPVQYYIDQVGDRGQWDKVWIVCDEARQPWEKEYQARLVAAIGGDVIMQHGSLLEDWTILRRAHNIISSNSTFAWSAMILGIPRFAVIPHTGLQPHTQRVVPLAHIPDCRIVPYRVR